MPWFWLLAQAAMALPPLGFLHGPGGRLYPVYGMRGNFLLGEAAPETVRSAAVFAGMTLWKMPDGIRVSDARFLAAPEGRAVFAWRQASGTLVAWIRESRRMLRWEGDEGSDLTVPEGVEDVGGMVFTAHGVLRMVWKVDGQLEAVEFSLDTGRIVSREDVPGEQATLDSNGNVWSSGGADVSCGGRHWTLAGPLKEFSPLADGWMALRTEPGAEVARCTEPELFQLPVPMP
ncbi:MAG: hypothetical protein IT166_08645 [Bryobacterales bacterium]|nr:hypothetical protein [Bryobacterales bacterium]